MKPLPKPQNPHPILVHLEKDLVGEIEVRQGNESLGSYEADLMPGELENKLLERGCKGGHYTVYGRHFETNRQLPGYQRLYLRGDPLDTPSGSPDQIVASLLREQLEAIRAREHACDERQQALDAQLGEAADVRRQALDAVRELEGQHQRHVHSEQLTWMERRAEVERQREEDYQARLRQLDLDRAELAAERQRLMDELHAQRLAFLEQQHEARLTASEAAHEARLEALTRDVESRVTAAEQTHNPLAALRHLNELPEVLQTRIADHILPAQADEGPEILKWIGPLGSAVREAIGGMRSPAVAGPAPQRQLPDRLPAIPPHRRARAARQSVAPAPSTVAAPATPSGLPTISA